MRRLAVWTREHAVADAGVPRNRSRSPSASAPPDRWAARAGAFAPSSWRSSASPPPCPRPRAICIAPSSATSGRRCRRWRRRSGLVGQEGDGGLAPAHVEDLLRHACAHGVHRDQRLAARRAVVLEGWMTRSFVHESRGPLRVATTVPTTRARNTVLLHLDAVDHADDARRPRAVLEAGGHARGGAGHDQRRGRCGRRPRCRRRPCGRASSLPLGSVVRPRAELRAHEPLVLRAWPPTVPTTRPRIMRQGGVERITSEALPMGRTSSRLRVRTRDHVDGDAARPRRAAAAPASVAALTAATSPRTSAVTYPDPDLLVADEGDLGGLDHGVWRPR